MTKIFKDLKSLLPCLFIIMIIGETSCKKNFLDEKPDSQLVVLSSLQDFQTLMDNSLITVGSGLGEVGGDNYYLPTKYLNTTNQINVSQYLWAFNGYAVNSQSDWTTAYQNIFTCNTALNGLGKISKNDNSNLWNQVYGTALFYRASQYLLLSEDFIKPYNTSTANTDPGVPLRLIADITEKAGRGTAQGTYNQILSDLKQASALLPVNSQLYKTRPTRTAAFAQISRTYLNMGDYNNSFLYADSALQLNNILLDYNSIPTPSASSKLSMPAFPQNPEVFWYASSGVIFLQPKNAAIDSALYQSYAINDLRKTLFFNIISFAPSVSFRGTYDGTFQNALFSAPAVDELYLIRAECYARKGNAASAMNDLNTLLIKRYKTGTFIPFTATDANNALSQVLTERRKELVMRTTRWADLRRLNSDPMFAKTLTRVYKGTTYTLLPNSNEYTWPIPNDEIIYSGIAQNPR